MKITIIAVGKLKERFWKEACEEYLKRLGAYARVEVKELIDIDPAKAGGVQAACEKEALSILAAIPQRSRVVLLASEGKQYSSDMLSKKISSWGLSGDSAIVFILGGSSGVADKVKARADETISFGEITLPHNLARVVLLEQVYRSFKIARGEPYHK